MADGEADGGQTPPPPDSRPPAPAAPSWGAVSVWAAHSTVSNLPAPTEAAGAVEGGEPLDPWAYAEAPAVGAPVADDADSEFDVDLDGVEDAAEASGTEDAAERPGAEDAAEAAGAEDAAERPGTEDAAEASGAEDAAELPGTEDAAEAAGAEDAAEAAGTEDAAEASGAEDAAEAAGAEDAEALQQAEPLDLDEELLLEAEDIEAEGDEVEGDEVEGDEAEGDEARAPAERRPLPPPLPGVLALGSVPAPPAPGSGDATPAFAVFAEGGPPPLDPWFAEGAVQPVELPIAASGAAAQLGHIHRLLRRLRQEVRVEADPRRRAGLLLDFGVLASEVLGDLDAARVALWAAWLDDPELAPARWALDRVLARRGERETRLTVLMRGDADALARAGHMAMLPPADPTRALEAWAWAAEYAPAALGPTLAAVMLRAATPGTPELAGTLEWALGRAQTGALWDALLLEHTRTAVDEPAVIGPRLHDAVSQQSTTPALLALAEGVADRDADPLLALAAAEARERREAGQPPVEARARLAVARGWALERLGRFSEALAQFARALEAPQVGQRPSLRLHAEALAMRMGDPAAAAAVLWEDREAAVLQPPADRARRAHRLGRLALATGDTALARTAFEAALDAEPTHWPSLADLSRRLVAEGDWLAAQSRAVDEIAAREEALQGETVPGRRAAAVRALLDRYYRLARLVEHRLDAPELALAYDKRALGLDPRFAPALLAMERALAGRKSFSALAALYRGRADRAGEAAAQRPWLRAAADVLRVQLDRSDAAARLYARLLQEDPFDREALEGALACLERAGDAAAGAAAADRLADRADGPEAVEARLRAALLHERAGQLGEALACHGQALAVSPIHPLALDGVARLLHVSPPPPDADAASEEGTPGGAAAAVLLSLANEALVEARTRAASGLSPGAPTAGSREGASAPPPPIGPESLHRLSPLQHVTMVEALLASGRLELAARWLRVCRAAGGRPSDAAPFPEPVLSALNVLEMLVAEARGDWARVVAAVERRAAELTGRAQAVLLARLGELSEFRLGDAERALAAYERALDAWPACRAARDGFARLGPPVPVEHVAGPWWQRAAQARSPLERRHILEAEAAGLADAPEADALRTLAGTPQGDSLEARLARGDLPAELLATPGRARGAASARLARAVAGDDDDALEAAIEALHALDAHAPLVASARRRLARRRDDAAGARAALDALADRLGETLTGAAVRRAAATEATAHGADPARIVDLLEAAVRAAPDDAERAQALAERLIADGDWTRLRSLYRVRWEALADGPERLSVARALAGLEADHFADPGAAAAALAPVVSLPGVDTETLLRLAEYAERAHLTSLADAARTRAALDPEARVPVGLAQAEALEARGDGEAARKHLEALLVSVPTERVVHEALADLLSRQKDWRALLRTLLTLLELEPTDVEKARRALAVAHILSRVLRDHRRAAGWYKRALELDATRLDAVARMLGEVEALGPAHGLEAHLSDALDRAVEGQRARLRATTATDLAVVLPEVLEALFELHGHRGDADARWVVGALSAGFGWAAPSVQAWVAERTGPVAAAFGAPLTEEWRQRWLVDEREQGSAGAIFQAFAPGLRLLFARPTTPGVAYGPGAGGAWRSVAQALGDDLGVTGVVWCGGPRALESGYAGTHPQPFLVIDGHAQRGPTPTERFHLAAAIEALRDGRALLLGARAPDLHGALAPVALTLCARLGARFVPADRVPPAGFSEAALTAAQAMATVPRQHLEALVARGESPADFEALVAGVRATAHRAGLLALGDPALALAAAAGLGGPKAGASVGSAGGEDGALVAAVATHADARMLLHYTLGAAHLALRSALGLTVRP